MSPSSSSPSLSSPTPPSLDELRRYAIARTLFKPTTLQAAIRKLGFVQADPMRAPARAQDLILRLRVSNYRAGDLERRYASLHVEEDCFVNYGFVERKTLALLHPRRPLTAWDAKTEEDVRQLLAFVRERGATHPKHVLEAFSHHGRRPGYWGGDLNVSTLLLDDMHYRGLLRVQRRESGTRVYQHIEHAEQEQDPSARLVRAEALVDMVVRLYAPLPSASLVYLASLLRLGAPDLRPEIREVVRSAKQRYGHGLVQNASGAAFAAPTWSTWYWPADETPRSRRHVVGNGLRMLAPFDPLVWDRRRFQALWGWVYRFEAYVPAAKRTMGHYALPLLWQDRMLGWANLRLVDGRLMHELGFVAGKPPGSAAFISALEEELEHMRIFLGAA